MQHYLLKRWAKACAQCLAGSKRSKPTIYLIICAAVIDLLIGDPKSLPHPVVLMGCLINFSRKVVEYFAKDNHLGLRAGGLFITLILVLSSGITGYAIERLFLNENSFINKFIASAILIFCLASSLAARSLGESIINIIKELPAEGSNHSLQKARIKLSHIVGRNVDNLDRSEILRASAESFSENAVDGVFAPLFWMLIGIFLWSISSSFPGPLTFALIFKSVSTLDSMIGYKYGNLKWLGSVSAKLDDILVYIPCRLVLLTLPLVSRSWKEFGRVVKSAYRDGIKDSSPNSGISEAIFAYCSEVRMGGKNKYRNKFVYKPILAGCYPMANIKSIHKLLFLGLKLEISWLICFFILSRNFI